MFSAPVPARRFPDQDSIPMDDYEYFSDLNINGVINGSIVIGAKYVNSTTDNCSRGGGKSVNIL